MSRFARPTGRQLVALLVALPWLAWAVVRGFGLESGYPLVPALALTPYVALLSPIPVIVAFVLKSRRIALLALVASLALLLSVAPRLLGGGGAGPGPELTVMSANLFKGRGDVVRVMEIARAQRVDVLSVQEIGGALERLDRAGARRTFPHRVVGKPAGCADCALLSRAPLREEKTRGGRPEVSLTPRGSFTLRLAAVHTQAPLDGRRAGEWERDLAALPGTESDDQLRVLIGDFNATLDQDAFRQLIDRGYEDAAEQVGAGLKTTWPIGRSRPPIQIDHVLADERIDAETFATFEILESDHKAIVVRLGLPE